MLHLNIIYLISTWQVFIFNILTFLALQRQSVPISCLNKCRHNTSAWGPTQWYTPIEELEGAEKAMKHCPYKRKRTFCKSWSTREESSLFRYEIRTPALVLRSSHSIGHRTAPSVGTQCLYQLLLHHQLITSSLATRNRFPTITLRKKVDISLFPIKAYILLHSSPKSWISLPAHPFFFWEERFKTSSLENLSSFLVRDHIPCIHLWGLQLV